ncbi:MAG: DUF4172 domain-containing protein [Chromatiaceae bacterium]|nr:DUF4172 domain-containing protein [Chromatiaceae bacterium]
MSASSAEIPVVTYIWQHPAWPHWRYDLTRLATPLAQVRHAQSWPEEVITNFP